MSGTVEIPKTGKCRYCKAIFDIDPRHPNKEFCKEGHRKLFWRYGQHSVTKVAERMQRHNQKLIESEIRAMRSELKHRADILQGQLDMYVRLLKELESRVRVLEARGGAGAAA